MFEKSESRKAARDKVAELLMAAKPNGILTYNQLTAITGQSIEMSRPVLYQALRDVNKSHGLVFQNVHGVGYQRASCHDLAQVARSARGTIRRKSKRTKTQIVNAIGNGRDNGVSPDEMKQLHAEVAVFGMIALAALDKRVGAVRERITNSPPSATSVASLMFSKLARA